MAGYSCYRCWK